MSDGIKAWAEEPKENRWEISIRNLGKLPLPQILAELCNIDDNLNILIRDSLGLTASEHKALIEIRKSLLNLGIV